MYTNREDLASATELASRLAADAKSDPQSFDARWQLARISYWLGGHALERDRRTYLEQGIVAAQEAARLQPQRPDGHFWTAANMGAIAERFGMRAGLKYRRSIRQALEIVLRLDPAYMEGSADRALGRYFHKVPALLGGSRTKAERHLRASLSYNPDSTISHYFLAELFIDSGRVAEARVELQRVSDAPLSREWAPEDRDFKRRAATLVTTLK